MSSLFVLAIVVIIGLVAFFIGRQRAGAHDRGAVKPHSRAYYHGWWAFLLAVLPAVLFLVVWNVGSSFYVDRYVQGACADSMPKRSRHCRRHSPNCSRFFPPRVSLLRQIPRIS